ncbi:imidazole glycerol phosphate synthase subunit HisH [Pseudoflavitalea sp. G-6-1-2]|uniref:imidazole glycerol phosphate synthase subunit HisH n=1 Tax=Pseudoflavitalea sp. G-6-1-2 TaxID=2728841 RepID=UPI00146CE0E6|nr:imidazole glycerol phosphate synthase subunit HisH [Pseudoflavitalea sp. G-6-1-2]
MELAIVKYNAGNIQSVLYALERIGATAVVTDDHEQLRKADKVIFPGVGEASSAMRYLQQHGLDTVLKDLQQPVLGICLGMQLMCAYSEENNTPCLRIFEEKVKHFESVTTAEGPLKIPQIGWNNIWSLKTDLFKGVPENSFTYFVHGYYAALGEHTIATTTYGHSYSSALHRGNFYGVQFHPEKSAAVGETILGNFLKL